MRALGRTLYSPVLRSSAGGFAQPIRAAVRTMATAAKELYYDEPGEPLDVLKTRDTLVPEPKDGEIVIKMVAAAINPSDINTVQGKYPIKPELPGGVTGHEGVGQVIATGSGCKLVVGDMAVPITGNEGTWRTHGLFQDSHWYKLPVELPVADAATILINPGTALLMLESFVDLQAGDCVVQNGANSQVGRYVSSICKSRGIKNVAVVRERSDHTKWQDLVDDLTAQGADLVVTHEGLKSALKDSGLPPPSLALNCVCGESATSLAKSLAKSGTIVTYGAMSMKPLTIPAPLLIFKDLRARGFWISGNATEKMGSSGRAALVDRLAKLISDGVIRSSAREFKMADWRAAFEAARSSGPKVLLRFDE